MFKLSLPGIPVAVLLTAMLSGCSGSTEDVRITLCKDLAGQLLSEATLQSEDMIVPKYEDLEVKLSYQAGQAGEAARSMSCFYPYNVPEENILDHVRPSEAFDTYPNRVVLDGQPLPSAQAARLINQVLVSQGKSAINNLQQQIEAGLSK